jgi:hypothetical protein
MTAPCPRCGRPPATSALWDHPDTCPCAECAASCFDECMSGKTAPRCGWFDIDHESGATVSCSNEAAGFRNCGFDASVSMCAEHKCRCSQPKDLERLAEKLGPWPTSMLVGGSTHTAPPAAGEWVRVEAGCEMPASGTTFLVWHQDDGSDASIWSVNDPAYLTRAELLGAGVTHWAPLNAPEATS